MRSHGPLQVETFVDPVFQENALLLWREGGTTCWILDPGFAPQPEQIADAVRQRGLSPAAILLTHCHPDHIAGVGALRREFPEAPIVAPDGEEHMLTDPRANMSDLLGMPVTAPPADQLVRPGQTLSLDGLEWQVLDVSGHSPAGVAYHCPEAHVVIGGDALFAGSIGRYDFPGSSRTRLLANIERSLLALPDRTVLYSGHGPATTIGRERAHNLVLRAELAG